MKATNEAIEAIEAYCGTLVWQGCDYVTERRLEGELTAKARRQCVRDLNDFLNGFDGAILRRALEHGASLADIASDFALNRHGHGAGAQDRGYPYEVERVLTQTARTWGDVTMRQHGDRIRIL